MTARSAMLGLVCALLLLPAVAYCHNDPQPDNFALYTGSSRFSDNSCHDCHSDSAVNRSFGSVTLGFNGQAATTYVPGATIPITITISDTGGGRNTWGFELAARFATAKQAGTFTAINSNTHTLAESSPPAQPGVVVITHYNAVQQPGTSFTFTVNWTAPAAGSGTIYFSVAGNAANGNNDLTGDRIYTTEVALTQGSATTPPSVGAGGITNAASYVTTVAQGQIISIFGSNLTTASSPTFASTLPLPTSLGGAQVSVCGGTNNVPLFYVSSGQINAQLPSGCVTSGVTNLTVTVGGQTSSPQSVTLGAVSPGIFTIGSAGTGVDGVILHTDGVTLVTPSNPAHAGEVVVIYATGLGAVQTPVPDGQAASGGDPATNTATATIGGQNAPVDYAGLTPGDVALYQVNAHVPTGLGTASVQVIIKQSNVSSRSGVTMSVAP